MSSPVSQETLQQLRESAEETAKKFGISYSINAACTLYDRAREAAEKKEDNLKLTYRDFDAVNRTDLLAGYVDVREGEGPGAMRSWKKVYLVERNDYTIEFYLNKGAFEKHRKPKTTIRPTGYKVLTKDIAKPFRDLIEPIARGLDVDPGTLDGMVKFPDDSWALFHPQRTKYVFRMCQNKKRRFGRRKKEPPTTDEELIDRKEWIYFLQTCVRRHKARTTDTVLGMAFDKTCKKIPSKIEALKEWKDDGTEDEMLLEMLLTSCLPPVQDIILGQIKGYLSIPLAPFGSFASIIASRVLIPIWYTTVGLIKKTIQGVLNVTWAKIQQGAQALLDKIEPVLQRGLAPITKVHNKVLDGIKSATNKTFGRLLAKTVTPLIEPLIEAYAKPMKEGFTYARETYWTAVTAEDLPKDATKRTEFLNAVPRTRNTMKTLYMYALQLSKSLGPVKKLIAGTVKMIKGNNNEGEGYDEEEDEDAVELCAEAEESLLKGLDAIVYTLHLRLENGEKMNDALMEKLLTEEFDRDAILLKRDVVKKGIRQFALKYFKMAIDADGQISQAIESVDAMIPSEMQDFLSVQGIFDAFIEIVVGEPIDRMVEAAKAFK